jgi:hypothetical protein
MSDTAVPKSLFHVEPREGNPERIHRLLRENIQENYVRIVDEVEEAIDDSGYDVDLAELRKTADRLDPDNRFTPPVYVNHAQVVAEMGSDNPGQVIHHLGKFHRMSDAELYRTEGIGISSAVTEPWEDYAIPVAKSETPGVSFVFPIGDPAMDDYREELRQAIDYIESVDPLMGEEIREYVDGIKLFTGHNIIGATSPKFYGNIFLQRPGEDLDRMERIAYFVEHLVHETSHLHASALQIHDDLILNPPDETYTAPIRPDARPMSGNYHATFVLTRIRRVFGRLADEYDEEAFSDHQEKAKAEWEAGYRIVEEHGDLTEAGEQIFEEFDEVAAD